MHWTLNIIEFLEEFGSRDIRGYVRLVLYQNGAITVHQDNDLVYQQSRGTDIAHAFHVSTTSFLTSCADILEVGHPYAIVRPNLVLETPEECAITI